MARLVGLEGSQLPGVKDPVGIGVTAACRIRAKFLILGSWHAVASCATCLDTHRKRILPNPVSRAGEYHIDAVSKDSEDTTYFCIFILSEIHFQDFIK